MGLESQHFVVTVEDATTNMRQEKLTCFFIWEYKTRRELSRTRRGMLVSQEVFFFLYVMHAKASGTPKYRFIF